MKDLLDLLDTLNAKYNFTEDEMTAIEEVVNGLMDNKGPMKGREDMPDASAQPEMPEEFKEKE
jgi:hypothetical protein